MLKRIIKAKASYIEYNPHQSRISWSDLGIHSRDIFSTSSSPSISECLLGLKKIASLVYF